MARPTVHTYEEARHVVEDLGILPLSSFLPGHPSLGSITEPTAWHTGTGTDPWLWRGRFAEEGVAAYGRFLGDKPLLISRELFPLMSGMLAAAQTVEERYAAGLLAGPALLVYDCVRENEGIDVKTLRMLTQMQRPSVNALISWEKFRSLRGRFGFFDIPIQSSAGDPRAGTNFWNGVSPHLPRSMQISSHEMSAFTLPVFTTRVKD